MSNDFNLKKMFLESTDFTEKVYLQNVTFIPKNNNDEFLNILQKNYEEFSNARGTDRFKKMLLSILNACYTQNRAVFMMSGRTFRKMAKSDFNHGPDGLKWDQKIWANFIGFLTKNKILEILNPEVKGTEIAFIYKIINPSFLKFFETLDLAKQEKECWNYIIKTKASHPTASQGASREVRSTKYTSSANSGILEEKIESEVNFKEYPSEKKDSWDMDELLISSETPVEQPIKAIVEITPKLMTKNDFYWNLVQNELYLDEYSNEHQLGLAKLKVVKFALALRLDNRDSSQSIFEKCTDAVGAIPIYGPHFLPVGALRKLIENRAKEVGPKFPIKIYFDKLETAYSLAVNKHDEAKAKK